MKKIVTLGLVLLLTASLLVGCGGGGGLLSSNLNGTDAAKLLLANERLNAGALEGGIFENGVAVFENLASIARENLIRVTYSGENATPELLSDGGARSVTKHQYPDGSVVEIEGDLYRFKNFAEYSNSYSYFENISGNVIHASKRAAELIDRVKTNVRILDTWVSDGYISYYLHVEADMEILFSRYDGQVEICRRTKNADGKNTYELFLFNDMSETRLVYIPGELCEFSHESLTSEYSQDFVATNTKGFWEVVDIGRRESGYNVSCMVLKDDICYDAFYDPGAFRDSFEVQIFAERYEGEGDVYEAYLKAHFARPLEERLPLLKVISADRATDIANISTVGSGATVELALYGFDGISAIEVNAPADRVMPESEASYEDTTIGWIDDELEEQTVRVFYVWDSAEAVLVTQNGSRVREGDTFCDGKVKVNRFFISYFNKTEENGFSAGYAPQLQLGFTSDDHSERMALLSEFLDEIGLTCRRDLDYVERGITRAYDELAEFVKHHTWQGHPIESSESITKGFAVRAEKYQAWRELYASVKDAEIVELGSSAAALKMQFPEVTVKDTPDLRADGLHITVGSLALEVEDTLLLVENENYSLHFALLGKGANAKEGLTHVALAGGISTAFVGGEVFTVAQQGASFDLPVLGAGEYTVVAYMATADGIRVSKYIPVVFSEVKGMEKAVGNLTVTTVKEADGTLTLRCESGEDVRLSRTGGEYGYEEMHRALSAVAYEYGFADADAVLEVQNADGSFVALTGDETALDYGVYRLRYGILNGTNEMHGYVIATYTAQ